MITLLLKTKMELFEWLQQQLYNGEEIERERDTGSGRTQAENSDSDKSCRDLYSFPFNSKFTELIVNNTPVLPEHVNMFFIFIYEIGYCYEDRR